MIGLLRPLPLAVALAGIALISSGCESTQEKSARIASELGPVKAEKGLKISAPSKDVRVLSSTLLTDPAGTAVVVEVRNDSGRDLAEVPISIDVRDAKGASVYRNDVPGIEPALTAIPFVEAGGTATWVNDQILATGRPKTVKVVVGAGGSPFTGELPAIEATEPKLEGDPSSGVVAGGNVVNQSGGLQERVLLYAVAREGERVVAAGRGAIERVKPEPKPVAYNIYFIGDPRGADVTVTLFGTLPGAER